MKTLAKILIRFYQYLISPILGPRCRFYPSCSQYAYQCYSNFNFIKASYLTFKRIIKCHPLNAGGYDPIPLKEVIK